MTPLHFFKNFVTKSTFVSLIVESEVRIRGYLIDPVNNIMYTDNGKEVPLTAFYLGCSDRGDAVLLWSADMDIPLATPEIEKEHLYQFVFR